MLIKNGQWCHTISFLRKHMQPNLCHHNLSSICICYFSHIKCFILLLVRSISKHSELRRSKEVHWHQSYRRILVCCSYSFQLTLGMSESRSMILHSVIRAEYNIRPRITSRYHKPNSLRHPLVSLRKAIRFCFVFSSHAAWGQYSI